jgi:hypothetical protein
VCVKYWSPPSDCTTVVDYSEAAVQLQGTTGFTFQSFLALYMCCIIYFFLQIFFYKLFYH